MTVTRQSTNHPHSLGVDFRVVLWWRGKVFEILRAGQFWLWSFGGWRLLPGPRTFSGAKDTLYCSCCSVLCCQCQFQMQWKWWWHFQLMLGKQVLLKESFNAYCLSAMLSEYYPALALQWMLLSTGWTKQKKKNLDIKQNVAIKFNLLSENNVKLKQGKRKPYWRRKNEAKHSDVAAYWASVSHWRVFFLSPLITGTLELQNGTYISLLPIRTYD